MKKLQGLILLILMVSFAFSESGQLHLIYSNASATWTETEKSYEFDVQAYLSDGSDVIGEGMVYIEYPEAVFNSLVVYNDKVTVELTGILAGNEPSTNLPLYYIVNVIDNAMNRFAITFTSSFNDSYPEMKSAYSLVSNDPANPSDLFHVKILAESEGQGNMLFPTSIPDIDYIYYDYEFENFAGGLDISAALEPVDISAGTIDDPIDDPIEDPIDDPIDDPVDDPVIDPVFAGSVDLTSFTAILKKSDITIQWATSDENQLSEYVIERSSNGSEYDELARIPVMTSKKGHKRYAYDDNSTVPGVEYSYRLLAVDSNGVSEMIGTTAVTTRGRKLMSNDGLINNDDMTLEASYPNPFNPSFTVPFTVHKPQTLDIRLYDTSGKVVAEVASGYHAAGSYSIRVNCDHLGSGVYLLRTRLNGTDATQKMLLVK